MKFIYILYQYLIAFPLLWVWTMFVAIITIAFSHWNKAIWLNRFISFWARTFLWAFFIPVSVTGLENIKKGQSYIFIANHQSMFDIWTIYGWLPVTFRWLMKQELRKIPFVGTACKMLGHVFIKRGSATAARESLMIVEKTLQDGICTVIFPEGTRSLDGQVGPFKKGAFRIALDLNLPIIPISLSGCFDVLNKNAGYVHRHPIHMHVGKPILPEQFDRENPQNTIDFIREEVIKNIKK